MTNGQFNNGQYANQQPQGTGVPQEQYGQPMQPQGQQQYQQPVQPEMQQQYIAPQQQQQFVQQPQNVAPQGGVVEQQQYYAQETAVATEQAVQQPQAQPVQQVQSVQQEPVMQQQAVVEPQQQFVHQQVVSQPYVDTPLSPSSITESVAYVGTELMKVDIIADIGNSGSRVVIDTNTTRFYFEMDNTYAYIEDINSIDRKYIGRKSTIIKDHKTGGYYANGHIVDVEFPNNHSKPIGFHKKAEQAITYVTLRAIIARAMVILHEHFKVHNLDCDITLNVLFPPLEAKKAGEILQSKIADEGLNILNCISPMEIHKELNISVNALAEGICGFFYSFYAEEGVVHAPTNSSVNFDNGDYEVYDVSNVTLGVVPDNIDFHQGDFLIIDIGAGTSDMLLGRNLEIIENSRETIRIGGNSVEASIKKAIRNDFGMEITPENILELVSKGQFTEGSHVHNGIRYVREAREAYAKAFKERLISYFDEQMYEPRQLKGLLVFGGGALETTSSSGDEKAEAMAHFIIKFLKEDLCPYVREIKTNPSTLRRANALGATMLTRY